MTIVDIHEEVLNDEKILLCCFCKKFLTDPQLLKCLHSCCNLCFKKEQGGTTIECPLCKEETECSNATPNSFLASRLHVLDFVKGNYKCKRCGKDSGYSCNSCCEFLCYACIEDPSNDHLDHVVVPLDENTSVSDLAAVPWCMDHDQPYEYACKKCQQVKCATCADNCYDSHHQVQQLDTEADEYILQIKDEISSLNRLLSSLRETFTKRITPIDVLDDAYKAACNRLEENKRRIVEALDKIYTAAEDELHEIYESQRPKALYSTDYAKSFNDKSLQAIEYCDLISKTAEQSYVLMQRAPLTLRLISLVEETQHLQATFDDAENIKIKISANNDIEETMKLWIGLPTIFPGETWDESLPKKAHTDAQSGEIQNATTAYKSFQSSVACNDVILSEEGNLMLAALGEGLIEYTLNGEQLSQWRPGDEYAGTDLVWTIDSLEGNRIVAGLYPTKRMVILRLKDSRDREWLVDGSMDVLQCPPYSLSVHRSLGVAAFAECAHVDSERPPAGSVIALIELAANKCVWRKRLEYNIGCVAISDNTVVSASIEKLHFEDSLQKKEANDSYVIDGFSYSGQLLWRQGHHARVYDISTILGQETFYVASDSMVSAGSVHGGFMRKTNVGNSVQCLNEDFSLSVKRVSHIMLAAVALRNSKPVSVYIGVCISDKDSTGSVSENITSPTLAPSWSLARSASKRVTTKICPSVIEMEMKKIEAKVGSLTYYFGADRKFTVHLEDRTIAEKVSPDEVKRLIETALRKCMQSAFDIVVINTSAQCLFTSVGACMNVGGNAQRVGMYLQGNGAIYWFSVAHAYLQASLVDGEQSGRVLKTVAAIHRRDPSGMLHVEVPLTLPHPLPHELGAADILFVSNNLLTFSGNRLYHSLDVMGGQLPPNLYAEDRTRSERAQNLDSVYKKCTVCSSWFCNDGAHPTTSVLYSITGVSKFDLSWHDEEPVVWFDCSRLQNSIVFCFVGEKKGVAIGRVIHTGPINTFYLRHSEHSNHIYEMKNLLVIEQLGDANPDQGDSGGVWVESTNDGLMAVAITIGVHKNYTYLDRRNMCMTKDVWLAVLMRAALEAMHGVYVEGHA